MGKFDDLIPNAGQRASRGGAFDDLIPKKGAAAAGRAAPSIPKQIPNPTMTDKVGAVIGSATNALMFDQMPNILAGVDTLTNGRSYAENVAGRRAVMARQREIVGPIPQIAGALAPAILAPQLSVPGLIARMGPRGAAAMKTLPGSTAAIAADAAATGALVRSGSGEGTSLSDLATDGAIGAGANLLLRGAGRVINPVRNRASAEEQQLIDLLDKEGIPISAGDRTRARWLQNAETVVEDMRDSGLRDRQLRAYNKSLTKRVSPDPVENITPEYLAKQQAEIGARLDAADSALKLTAANDPRWQQEVAGIRQEYLSARKGLKPQRKVTEQLDKLYRLDKLDGTQLRELKANLRAELKNSVNKKGSDSAKARAYRKMLQLVDDQVERSFPKDSPIPVRAKQANSDYSALQVLQEAKKQSPTGRSSVGFLSTPAVERAAGRRMSLNAYSRGESDLANISSAVGGVVRNFPNSGTPQRLDIDRLARLGGQLAGIGTSMALGAGTGQFLSGSTLGLLMGGAIGGAAAKPLLSRALMNKYSQAYLGGTTRLQQLMRSPAAQQRLATSGAGAARAAVMQAQQAGQGGLLGNLLAPSTMAE